MKNTLNKDNFDKIRVNTDKIEIDDQIFSGLATRTEMDQKFNQFGTLFEKNLDKHVQLFDRQKYNKQGLALQSLLDFQQMKNIQPNKQQNKTLNRNAHSSSYLERNNKQVKFDSKNCSSKETKSNHNTNSVNKFVTLIQEIVHNPKQFQNPMLLQRVCTDFAIDPIVLQTIKETSQREKYILESMNNGIQSNLNIWDKQQQKQKESTKKLKSQSQSNDLNYDIYYWLDLNTKFQALKKKIKQEVFNALNDDKNKKIIENSENRKKLDLEVLNVNKQKQNGQIMKYMTKFIGKCEQKKQIAISQQNLNIKTEETFDWDSKDEEQYYDYIKQAKGKIGKDHHGNNFRNLGFTPAMLNIQKQEKDIQFREKLITKFNECIPLTANEHKFLADTSELLNKNLDKRYVQKTVNKLSSEFLDELELKIADQILEKYDHIKEQLRDGRLKFISDEVQYKKEKVKQIDTKILQKNEKQQNFQKNRVQEIRLKNKLIKILANLSKQNRIQTYVRVFAQKMLNFLPKYSKQNVLNNERFQAVVPSFLDRNYNPPLKTLINLKSETMNVLQLKKKFHPPEKLILNLDKIDDSEKAFFDKTQQTDEMIALRHQRYVQRKCKTSQNSIDLYNQNPQNSQNFQNFYSNGPVQVRRFKSIKNFGNFTTTEIHDYQQKDKWITKDVELQACIIIQRATRKFISRKKFQELRSQHLVDSNFNISEKVTKMVKSKQMFKELVKELNQQYAEKGEAHQKKSILFISTLKEKKDQFISQNNAAKIMHQKQITGSYYTQNSYPHQPTYNASQQQSRHQKTKSQILAPFQNPKQQFSNWQQKFSSHITNNMTTTYHTTKEHSIHDTIEQDTFSPMQNQLKLKEEQKHIKETLNYYQKQRTPAHKDLKIRKIFTAAKQCRPNLLHQSHYLYDKQEINVQDEFRNTVKNECIEVVDFLLKRGADCNIQGTKGNTPLHMAFKTGNQQIILSFLGRGANLNIVNWEGHTPLAFGSEIVLQQLNLIDGVCKISDYETKIVDNNKLILQMLPLKTFENETDVPTLAKFGFQYLNRNDDDITEDLKLLDKFSQPVVKSFVQSQERKQIDIQNEKYKQSMDLVIQKEKEQMKEQEFQKKRQERLD